MPVTNKIDFFVPAQMSGCVLWLDGMDPAGTGVAPSTGATISTWNDKSLSAKHATKGGTPTYVAGGGVNFNGSAFFYNLSFAQNLSQRSIFIVMQETTHPYTAGVFPLIPNPSTDNDWTNATSMTIETTNGLRFYGNVGSYSSDIGNSTQLVKAIYNDNMNATIGSGFLNGINATNVTAGYTAGTCSGYGVGARWSGSTSMTNGLSGIIYEIIFFNRPLIAIERLQVEGYLAQKWALTAGLPAGHPGLIRTYYVAAKSSTTIQRRPGITKTPYFKVFTPTSIGGCVLWLDAADSSTVTGTAPITAWTDKSGAGRTVTITSGPTYGTTSQRGKNTMYFSNNVITSSIASAVGTGDFTLVAVWYQYSAGTNTVLSLGTVASSSQSLGFSGNKYNFYQYGDANESDYSATTPSWVVQVGTRISSVKKIYINGNVGTTPASTSYNASVTTITIGKGDNFAITGEIGEILVYTGTMSDTNRQLLESYLTQKWGLTGSLPVGHAFYTNPGGGPQLGIVNTTITISGNQFYITDGLVYHLDAGNKRSYSGSGSTWTDLTGSGIAATLVGSPTYSSANGGSLLFDGSTQYATTASSIASISGTGTSWTIEAFIYYNATSSGGGPCIFTNYYTTGNLNIPQMLGAISPGANVAGVSNPAELQVGYYVRNNPNSSFYVTPEQTPLTSGNWYHIVGTFDRTNLKLYINNVLNNTTASTAGTLLANTAGYRIMTTWNTTDNPAGFWGGNLAILRLYSRALTADEVTTNYNSTRRPPSRFGLS